MKNKNYWWLSLGTFLIDFTTKMIVLYFFNVEEEFFRNDIWSIQRVWNASYILSNVSFNVSLVIFRILWVSFAVFLALAIYWVSQQCSMKEKNIKTNFAKMGLFIIMGGIWGNCFDRIFRPEGVIDFIRLNFFEHIVPIINFADIFIYLGIFYIILSWYYILKEGISNVFNKKVA